MVKGPFVKKVKGNYLFYLNGYHFKLWFILFLSLKKQSCFFLGKRMEQFQIKMTFCAFFWVSSLCLRAQPEGACRSQKDTSQFCNRAVAAALPWNRTSTLSWYCSQAGRILSILVLHVNWTFPEQNPFNLHRYQLQFFWPGFNSFFLQRYPF